MKYAAVKKLVKPGRPLAGNSVYNDGNRRCAIREESTRGTGFSTEFSPSSN